MTRTFSLAVHGLVALILVQAPGVARACAVCTAGRDEENAFAFLLTTIFMSIMPLAAIGTLVFVLWRRIQRLEANSSPPEPSVASSASSEPRVGSDAARPNPIT